MKSNRNLALLFSAGAVVVILAVLVPVIQNRQELRQHAAGVPTKVNLPTQDYRNPYYGNTKVTQPPLTITLPPENERFQSPNDTIPPLLSIISPTNGTTVQPGTAITITATATDNIAVAKVEFLVNGQTICTQTASPYTCSWTVPNQTGATYLIVVRATDLTGNISSKSVVVRIR